MPLCYGEKKLGVSMVIPFLATAAWLGLGALGVLGAKEKETNRLRSNAALREQQNTAQNAVNRNYVAAQNAYSRYLRRESTVFSNLEQERWDALANINNQFLNARQNSTVFYNIALPVLKGTTLALDLFGGSILGRRTRQQ